MEEKHLPTHLITNKHRGIYVGTLLEERADGAVRVAHCRHVAYWVCDVPGGISSLAAVGPAAGTRAGAAAPEAVIRDVANTWTLSPDAAQAWADMKPQGDVDEE